MTPAEHYAALVRASIEEAGGCIDAKETQWQIMVFIPYPLRAALRAAGGSDGRDYCLEILEEKTGSKGHPRPDREGESMTPAERRAALNERMKAKITTGTSIRDLVNMALEEAAKAAYSLATQKYIAGNERDENGLYPPGSPYDRGRYDAAAAILALIEEK